MHEDGAVIESSVLGWFDDGWSQRTREDCDIIRAREVEKL